MLLRTLSLLRLWTLAMVTDTQHNSEHCWNITETGNLRSEKNLSEWHFVHQKSHMEPTGVGASLLRHDFSD